MATKTTFNSTGVPRSNTVFSQAVIANGFIFLSGTAGVDPATGQLINDSFEDQARQAFRNIETILTEAGSNLSKIVKTSIFMVAGQDPTFAIINKVYSEVFPTEPPARSAPQLMPFPGNILVSIECIALV
jgi:2-iminobutanoate/2-iminopropanoate deaminase